MHPHHHHPGIRRISHLPKHSTFSPTMVSPHRKGGPWSSVNKWSSSSLDHHRPRQPKTRRAYLSPQQNVPCPHVKSLTWIAMRRRFRQSPHHRPQYLEPETLNHPVAYSYRGKSLNIGKALRGPRTSKCMGSDRDQLRKMLRSLSLISRREIAVPSPTIRFVPQPHLT